MKKRFSISILTGLFITIVLLVSLITLNSESDNNSILEQLNVGADSTSSDSKEFEKYSSTTTQSSTFTNFESRNIDSSFLRESSTLIPFDDYPVYSSTTPNNVYGTEQSQSDPILKAFPSEAAYPTISSSITDSSSYTPQYSDSSSEPRESSSVIKDDESLNTDSTCPSQDQSDGIDTSSTTIESIESSKE